jgi:hypothetical protein
VTSTINRRPKEREREREREKRKRTKTKYFSVLLSLLVLSVSCGIVTAFAAGVGNFNLLLLSTTGMEYTKFEL